MRIIVQVGGESGQGSGPCEPSGSLGEEGAGGGAWAIRAEVSWVHPGGQSTALQTQAIEDVQASWDKYQALIQQWFHLLFRI